MVLGSGFDRAEDVGLHEVETLYFRLSWGKALFFNQPSYLLSAANSFPNKWPKSTEGGPKVPRSAELEKNFSALGSLKQVL